MSSFFFVLVAVIAAYYLVKFLEHLFGGGDKIKTNIIFTPEKTKRDLSFDNEAVAWCANLLSIDKAEFEKILYSDVSLMYKKFKIRKRSGGKRTIASPQDTLMAIQKTIYNRILLQVNIHPAATGFRKGLSIVNNVKLHLGKDDIIKTDLINFFGTIKQERVMKAFESMGYPSKYSAVLADLCCLNGHLPQGAPTSPALSNIISYEMDKKLTFLSHKYRLAYTRYADDITFSGNDINPDFVLPEIRKIANEEGFKLKQTKTRYINKNKRKLITGISISSGKKLTIPKAKKREIRKNVYFVLTKGLAEHQRFIKSTDPVYLKRLLCYLSFWKMVEPDNKYVINSITALKKIQA